MNFRSDEDVRADDDVRTEFMPFIQSQYSASVRIVSILESCREHILPDADIVSFFNNIFNVETAVGYGLDVWGNIVGVSRFIQDWQNASTIYTLNDEDFRKVLFFKAAANIMDSTMYSMNYLLHNLYPEYNCYIRLSSNYQADSNGVYHDLNPMVIEYVFFDSELTDLEKSIFMTVGDFNRGAGVQFSLSEYRYDDLFGFLGSELQMFGENANDGKPYEDYVGGVFYKPSIGG